MSQSISVSALHGDHEQPLALSVRLTYLAGVVLPFVGFVLAIVLLWGYGFTWLHLGLLLGTLIPTALGVTIGYHRLFTHRSFEAPRPVRAVLAILGAMALEGPVIKWAAQHRSHHQHSDAPGDPHSPHLHEGDGLLAMLRGLWHAHVGWIFSPDPPGLYRYAQDLLADRLLRVITTLYPLWIVLSLLIPAAIAGLITQSWTGAFLGFLWGGAARVFLVHHITWSINSVCHFWGSQPFRSHDHSRNNLLFGFLAMGEGWHNNHHAFPTSARHGLAWWQFDLSYYIIRAMAWVGLATKVKVPTPDTIAAKRNA